MLLTTLQDEARQLKRMITSRTKLLNGGIDKAQSLIKLLLAELASRDLFDNRSDELEKAALIALQEAQSMVDEGADQTAMSVITDLSDIESAVATGVGETGDEVAKNATGVSIRKKVAGAGRLFRKVLGAYETEYVG